MGVIRYIPENHNPPMGKFSGLMIQQWGEYNLYLKPGTNVDVDDEIIAKLPENETYQRQKRAIEIFSTAQESVKEINPGSGGKTKAEETAEAVTKVLSLADEDAMSAVSGLTDAALVRSIALLAAKQKRQNVADAANRRKLEIEKGQTVTGNA